MAGVTSGSSHPPPPKSNGTRVSALATRTKDNNTGAARGGSESGVAIFLSYWSITPESEENRSVAVSFEGVELSDTTVTATEYRIDVDSANPKRVWETMGSPKKPDSDQIKTLIAASKVVPTTVEAEAGVFQVHMSPNSAVVLVLE